MAPPLKETDEESASILPNELSQLIAVINNKVRKTYLSIKLKKILVFLINYNLIINFVLNYIFKNILIINIKLNCFLIYKIVRLYILFSIL